MRTDQNRIERIRAAGLGAALAAAAFAAACGSGTKQPTVVERTHGKQSTEESLTQGESVPVTTERPATVATSPVPSTPPTAEEIKVAWRDGVSLFDSGDFEGAAARLQIASEGRPKDAYVQYLHGLALWKSGHLPESETALQSASTLDESSVKTWVNLARVQLDRNEAQEALQSSERALALVPGSADAMHQRGRALAALGRRDEAIDVLQQARQADPSNGYVANTLGYTLLTSGRIEDAIPNLEAARDALPGVAYVRNNLGMAYERHGEVEKAVAEYQAAVQAGDSGGRARASLDRLQHVVERLARRGGGPGSAEAVVETDGSDSGTTTGAGQPGGGAPGGGSDLDKTPILKPPVF